MIPESSNNTIIERLSGVDFTSGAVDRAVIEGALLNHLRQLGLPLRPVTWAMDGNNAQERVARDHQSSLKEEVDAALNRLCGDSIDKDSDFRWQRPRDEARTAGRARLFNAARNAVCWQSVFFSIPWFRYQPGRTGDRGERANPEYYWRAGFDALEHAARAHAERELRRAQSSKISRQTNEHVWVPFVDAFAAGLWMFWINSTEVVALPRPVMKLNGEQIHSTAGPAITWPGSDEQHFFLNDVHVPKELVETPASQLDPRWIFRERNTGVRREMVRKIGIERICNELGAEIVDRQGDYELLVLDLADGRRRPFLKMKNPSIGVYHIEGVAPECHTVAEALAWRNQSDDPPNVLT